MDPLAITVTNYFYRITLSKHCQAVKYKTSGRVSIIIVFYNSVFFKIRNSYFDITKNMSLFILYHWSVQACQHEFSVIAQADLEKLMTI